MGQIVTFYSYKGGAGRTMGVANVAVALAQWGYRVLAVDWDFEAPGLEYYFAAFRGEGQEPQSDRGILWLLDRAFRERSISRWSWKECVLSISLPQVENSIDIIPAGDGGEAYHRRLRDIDVGLFYTKRSGGDSITRLRNEWKEHYDFVLVDSRTGVTDMNSICTVHLPDLLVMFCTPVRQSIERTPEVAQRVYGRRRDSPYDLFGLPILPILSRFDAIDEREISQRWVDTFVTSFSDQFDHILPREWSPRDRRTFVWLTKLPYVPYFSFGERLVVTEQDRDPGGLGRAYETLASLIARNLSGLQELLKGPDGYLRKAITEAPVVYLPPASGTTGAIRVHLSYADGDQEAARQAVVALTRAGYGVSFFANSGERRYASIDRIETPLRAADRFLALMSPAYLSSQWSGLELGTAQNIEQLSVGQGRCFAVCVAKIRDVPAGELDLLIRDRSRMLDLSGGTGFSPVLALLASLGGPGREGGRALGQGGPPAGASAPQDDDLLAFQDREEELADVISSVSRNLVLLLAMPAMGKTRLLKQLPAELMKRGGAQRHVVYISLRDEAPSVRGSIGELLSRVFPSEAWERDAGEFPTTVAKTILRSRQPWLILLDGADLLGHRTAVQLRQSLCKVIHALRVEGSGDKLGFVAASRVEIPAFKGIMPQPAFRTVVLKQFGADVIAKALQSVGSEAGIGRDQPFYQEVSRTVSRDTEGLPALLGKTLNWIKDNQFEVIGEPQTARSGQLFQLVVRPYVGETLLSPRFLLPQRVLNGIDAEDLAAASAAFSELVLGTAVFRLLTKSHLKLVGERHPELRDAQQTIERFGDPYDLFGALSVIEPNSELWHAPYAAVRRLYFRYRYPSAQQQLAAHQEAQGIYENWPDTISGSDLAQFHVERLWHEVEIVRLSTSRTADAVAQLRGTLDRARAMIDDEGVRRAVQRRVSIDDELQDSLGSFVPEFLPDLLAF